MKPPSFAYVRPESLPEALALLAEHGEDASILAGGQSLMPLLNMRLARPDILVDLNRLDGLSAVEPRPGSFHVGALVRAAALEHDPVVGAALPVIRDALDHVGHPQIRNRTTIGGNLAHADPSSELPGVLAALDGRVELTSARGARTLPWNEFFVSVFTTARTPEEIVTGVEFPTCAGWQFRFTEFARRHGDFPIVALTVGLRVEDGCLVDLRVAVTGVADRVRRLAETERLARGAALDPATIRDLARQAAVEVEPRSDAAGSAAYRRHLVATLLERTLTAEIRRAAA